MAVGTRRQSHDLVPVTTRLDALGIVRLVAALTTLVLLPTLPRFGAPHPGSMAALTAAYVTITLGIEWGRRRLNRRGIGAIRALLVLDAVYLAIVIARTGGHQSPALFLIYLHVVAVTLLVSYQFGLRIAVLHAWLLVLGHAVAEVGLLGSDVADNGGFPAAALNAATFLVVAVGAAACSSLNERALRASRSDLAALVELGADLEQVVRPDDVVDACCRHVCTRLGCARTAVVVSEGDRWWGAVGDTSATSFLSVAGGADAVVHGAWEQGEPQLVRSLASGDDPLLDTLLPGAVNVVVAALTIDGNHRGVLAAEWGDHGRKRIPASSVDAIAQTAAHASLTLRSALLLRTVEELATRDSLTGVANRRLFEEALVREVGRSERDGSPLSLIVLDLDHFKAINDTLGHQAGDEVLRQVGGALTAACRAQDLPARYGGEEFVVLLPECGSGQALATADRLRSAVHTSVSPLDVTVSAGVATLPDNALGADRLVAAADSALYDAKRAGRNRAVASARLAGEPADDAADDRVPG